MFRDRRILLLLGGVTGLLLCLAWFSWSDRHANATIAPHQVHEETIAEETSESDVSESEDGVDAFQKFLASSDDIKFGDDFAQSHLKENGSSESTWITAVALSSNDQAFRANLSKALQRYPDSEALNSIAAFLEIFETPVELAHGSAIDRLIELNPDNGLGWYMSATLAFSSGREEEGVDHYVKAGQSAGIYLFQNEITDLVADSLTGKGYSEAEALVIASNSLTTHTISFPRVNQMTREVINVAQGYQDSGDEARAAEINQAGFDLGLHFMNVSGAGGSDLLFDLVGAAVAGRFAEELDFDQLPPRYRDEKDYLDEFVNVGTKEARGLEAMYENMSEEDFLEFQTLQRALGWQSAADLLGR